MGRSNRTSKRSNSRTSSRSSASKIKNLSMKVSNRNYNIPYMFNSENINAGYNTALSGTNGYSTVTGEELMIKVFTVKTELGQLPIADRGRFYILGLGFISFEVEYVTYQTLYSTYRKIPTEPLPSIPEAYQRGQCKQALVRPNSFLFTVIEKTKNTIVGFAVGSLEYAEKSFTLPMTNNLSSFFSSPKSRIMIQERSPYLHYHLLGVFKSQIQKNVRFHGSTLMAICILLVNPSYQKENHNPLDIPIYLEAIKDQNVLDFYKRMGFYRFTKEGKTLFDHPLKNDTRTKSVPHLLLA